LGFEALIKLMLLTPCAKINLMKINGGCNEALIQRTINPKCLSWQEKESPEMVLM